MRRLFIISTIVMIASSAPAFADITCATICTVQLQHSNVVQLTGVQVSVTINNTGANTVLSFQLTNNPLTNTAAGIDQIGWTGGSLSGGSNTFSTDHNSVGSNWIGHNPNNTTFAAQVTGPNNGSMDGFGKFNLEGAASGSTDGVAAPIVLTLAGRVESFYSNSVGNVFTVHVRFGGNCSGFVGGLTGTGSANSDTDCVPQAQVPEPGTLALLGTGLFALGRVAKQKLRG